MGAITGTTISKLPTTLATLPAASELDLGGLPPWAVLPTGSIVGALGIDRGLWGSWRGRGIGPAELPAGWFRRTTGGPRFYRIDGIQAWLAARRGEPFDQHAAWMASLAAAGLPANRVWVHRLAERAGPGDVPFTVAGWRKYLETLL